ncbi:MAG: FtsQ-type POTRA domain-containing protein [Clostridia bacterium]|nr:FtsQ-type POTRA domain-containing protein [Clostridia bacterium]
MKGNGRVVAFFIVILLVVVLIVLNLTLFTISDITVLNKVYSDLIIDNDIITSSNIQAGSNIFSLSERKAISNIEIDNPYIKVTSIERKFPNKIIIHVTVRTAVMTIAVNGGDGYALLDSNLKILEIVNQYSNLYSASTKIVGITVDAPVIGNTLNTVNTYNAVLQIIGNIADNENLDGVAFLTFFEKITFVPDITVNNVRIKINSGVTFALTNNQYVEQQLRYCLEKYKLTDELSLERKSGYYFFDGDIGWVWTANIADLD